MAKLIIHPEKIQDIPAFLDLCPFGALEERDGRVEVGASCRMCRLCVKKGPAGAAEYQEDNTGGADKTQWNGIAVYADMEEGRIHPVTLELIGKARELAKKVPQPVYVLLLGYHASGQAEELRHYGADAVFMYDDPALERFRIEPYTAAFEDFILKQKPASILVGATTVGRQLAPRVAARMRTGLTADCTVLDMLENTDLVQIRPAFGGNIMAQIHTPNHRPQMATVRYKVMNAPKREESASGTVFSCSLEASRLFSRMEVLGVERIPPANFIEDADVLVVAGRGIKKPEDLSILERLAELLGGQLACTRPMAEAGWVEAKRQVGLSGRTVRPKLLIACGVSGSVQFVAGMDHSEQIIAINRDEKAPIFKTAHYGLIGDLYEIVPKLIENIEAEKRAAL